MGENIFEKFNEMMDIDGLKADVAKAAESTGDFVEVPHGDYEVKVTKIDLAASKAGAPMVKVWFDVLTGDFKGQKIFMNQMVTTGFGIYKMNEFLNSLETGIEVQFENFEQYAGLLTQIFNAVDGTAEFQLAYTANPKNAKFSEYKIVQRFKN
jgi:hypothetical protein